MRSKVSSSRNPLLLKRLDQDALPASPTCSSPVDANQIALQVELGLLAVETLQALDQRRRDNQGDIGVAEGIANQQAGPVWQRRRHEIQVRPQAGQWLGQISSYRSITGVS